MRRVQNTITGQWENYRNILNATWVDEFILLLLAMAALCALAAWLWVTFGLSMFVVSARVAFEPSAWLLGVAALCASRKRS